MSFLKGIFKGIGAIFGFVNKYFKTFVLIIILVLIFGSDPKPKANLAELSLNGTILDARAFLNQIYSLQEDKNIKGVLLNIDSPGGAMSASVEISDAIKNLAKTKPVIAYASGTLASGSYYSAIWANKIYANRGSFVGSIGVILQSADISKLANTLGIKAQIVKAGEFKEAGTFTRAWNEAERAQLQNLVNQSYEMFCKDVASARKLDINKSDSWANARVFLASKAKDLGLIDDTKNYLAVKKELEILSKVKNPIWQKPSKIDQMMDKISSEAVSKITNSLNGIYAY